MKKRIQPLIMLIVAAPLFPLGYGLDATSTEPLVLPDCP
jgi:hypothetical protein